MPTARLIFEVFPFNVEAVTVVGYRLEKGDLQNYALVYSGLNLQITIVKNQALSPDPSSTMIDERALAINPVVPESVQHNAQVVSQIRSLTASLFGVAAGILGLESYPGFVFYLIGTLIVSGLIWGVLAKGKPESFFESQLGGLWGKDVVSGLSSFVLTWTLFYGLVRS